LVTEAFLWIKFALDAEMSNHSMNFITKNALMVSLASPVGVELVRAR
jgi:hypothetical protein